MQARKLFGNALIIAGIILLALGSSFMSGFLSGFLGKNVGLDESHFLGASTFSWGMTLLVAGDIIKMYRNRLTKKTKCLLLIPCALYLLLLMATLMFPANKVCTIAFGSSVSTVLFCLVIAVSIAFWGSLLSGLYRMHREVQNLDQVDKK